MTLIVRCNLFKFLKTIFERISILLKLFNIVANIIVRFYIINEVITLVLIFFIYFYKNIFALKAFYTDKYGGNLNKSLAKFI